MKFEGRMLRSGRWWAIEVPILGVVTQGRTKKDALQMIKDAVETVANVKGFEAVVIPKSGNRFDVGSSDETTLIALLLRRQRQIHGLTLAEVSARLGSKSRNAYARYEQRKAVPTVTKLSELLKALNPKGDFILKKSA